MYGVGNVVGALIITYFVSRCALWALKAWKARLPRLVVAHGGSWLLTTIVVALIEWYSASAGWIYLLPQLFWLGLDIARTGKR